MKKNNLYIGLTAGLVLTSVLLTYYLTSLTADKHKTKGYDVAMFNPGCGSDPMYLDRLRKYITFNFTSDTVKNDQTIISMRSYLNSLKASGDSINGVHITMTNDMPYKYYLKSIEIFLERPPRIFFTIENNFYAVSKSKYQQTQDSILKINAAKDGVNIIEIDGREY